MNLSLFDSSEPVVDGKPFTSEAYRWFGRLLREVERAQTAIVDTAKTAATLKAALADAYAGLVFVHLAADATMTGGQVALTNWQRPGSPTIYSLLPQALNGRFTYDASTGKWTAVDARAAGRYLLFGSARYNNLVAGETGQMEFFLTRPGVTNQYHVITSTTAGGANAQPTWTGPVVDIQRGDIFNLTAQAPNTRVLAGSNLAGGVETIRTYFGMLRLPAVA